jgi:hypothetical protein
LTYAAAFGIIEGMKKTDGRKDGRMDGWIGLDDRRGGCRSVKVENASGLTI